MDRVSDLEFFVKLVRQGSLAALARELGVTPPAVTARLSQLERRLGVRLLNRTTRRISVTHEGEVYLATGGRLLAELQELEQAVSSSKAVPKGLLRVNATFGFGRRHIAPAVVEFARRYPEVEVQLELTDRSVNLADQACDIGIWFGTIPDSRMVARRIVRNRRLLCAAPAYLAKHGVPATPRDLQAHRCIVLRESDAAFGTWHLARGSHQETVKVRGTMSTLSAAEVSSNTRAANATRPVPGRRTASSTRAEERMPSHVRLRAAVRGSDPAATRTTRAVSDPTATIPSPRRSHARGSTGSA